MTRRSTSMGLAAMLAFAVIMLGVPQRAAAQSVPNNCCSFTIVASFLIPPGCLPFPVRTSWGGVAQNNPALVNGDNVVTFPGCPPGPPPATFDWVSLDGGATKVPFGGSGAFTLPCGLRVTYDVSQDGTGCYRIHIHP